MVDWYGDAAYIRPGFVQGWGGGLFTSGNATPAGMVAWRDIVRQ
jgi:hypothetical protein